MRRTPDEVAAVPLRASSTTIERMSSIIVRGLSEAVEQAGVPAEVLADRAEVDIARLAEPFGWFTLDEFDRLVMAALEITVDPAFGVHWGERSPMLQLDFIPNLLAVAPSMSAALKTLLELQPCFVGHEAISLTSRGNRCILRVNQLRSETTAGRVRVELSITGLVRILRYFNLGSAILKVSFTHARPAHGAEYDRFFGSAHFDQPYTGIELASADLERPRLHCNAELWHQLLQQAEQLRHRIVHELSYTERLEPHVRSTLPRLLTLPEGARLVGLSTRSLRRRLAEEGVSFSTVLDDVRRVLAHELLTQGTKSIKEVAHALGFESASGFNRALHRWGAMSPTSLRTSSLRE